MKNPHIERFQEFERNFEITLIMFAVAFVAMTIVGLAFPGAISWVQENRDTILLGMVGVYAMAYVGSRMIRWFGGVR